MEENSLFQVTDLRLGGVLSYHSDIVKAVIGADGFIETVSCLKNTYLNNMGYSFQIEQAETSDLKRYSAYITVSRNAATGRFEYTTDIGGDRGSGKRFEKPPEGLFDEKDEGDIPDSNPTEPPTDAPADQPNGAPVPNAQDGAPSHTAVLRTPAPVSRSRNASDPPESVSDLPVNAPADTVKQIVPDKTDQTNAAGSETLSASGKAGESPSDTEQNGTNEISAASPHSPFTPLRLLVGIAAVSGGAFAGLRMRRKR